MFLFILQQTIKMVAIGTIIALPLAYFIMSKWLENFAYRVHVGIGILISASLMAVLVAVITVSYLSIRAAVTNPVEALRYE
jgi:putative ABC transport system permease protein